MEMEIFLINIYKMDYSNLCSNLWLVNPHQRWEKEQGTRDKAVRFRRNLDG